MIFRIFLAVLLLVGAFAAYNAVRINVVKNGVYNVEAAYAYGSPDAAVQIVEFLDYSCGKCQQTHPALKAVLEENRDLRYIPRPILSETKEGSLAALFVYAAGLQGKFIPAHMAVIEHGASVNEAALNEIAGELELDLARVTADMNKPELFALLNQNKRYNEVLGSPTIPAFLINGRIFWVITDPIPTAEDFRKVIEEAKS